MLLSNAIRFQKTLALAAAASNDFEAAAAELAARRLITERGIDPTRIPDPSLYNRMNFAGNALLHKLRTEWREQHPLPPPRAPGKNKKGCYGPVIPFNINGFIKHTKKRKPQVQLSQQEHETIRLLLNSGLGLKEIAIKIGRQEVTRDTINSTRAYHIRKKKWQVIEGQFHWVTPRA